MQTADDVHDDLRYVRRALEESRGSAPAAIYVLWAVIGAVGMPLVDLAPQWAGVFWFVASPLGLLASVLLAVRHARRVGQQDRASGRRHALHWLALVVAAALVVPLAATGRIEERTLGQVILLLIAVVYFLAAVHLDGRLHLVALLLVGGYLALFALDAWVWTTVGVTTSAGLLACAWLARHGRGSATA